MSIRWLGDVAAPQWKVVQWTAADCALLQIVDHMFAEFVVDIAEEIGLIDQSY